MRLMVALVFLLSGFAVAAQEVNIVPKPVELKMGPSTTPFILNKKTRIVFLHGYGLEKYAAYFNDYLQRYYGFKLEVYGRKDDKISSNYIQWGRSPLPSTDTTEGKYSITVTKDYITIKPFHNRTGMFYAIQTLIQLLPVEGIQQGQLSIPQLTITDYPRFAYRGMHLDVSRHFFPVPAIKNFIDQLALHKMNYFHWHLTDDQGWRIQIKKYPRLTEIGAWRNGTIIGLYPGTGNDSIHYGGYYTQEEIKEVVKYAADRFITVIPEIDIPGHDMAALAAYPELGTRPDSLYKVAQTWGIFGKFNNVLSPTENTFQFLENVFDEVISLFPSPYIHIGGDEVSKMWWKNSSFCQQLMKEKGMKDEHELQSYFIRRVEEMINKKGRRIIGWDEILEGGLAPNAIVMSWRGEKGGIAAAKQKHQVIMTPNNPLYLNQSQSKTEDSLTAKGYNPVENVYNYEPVSKELTATDATYILGAQGNLWTEYIANTRKLEYMLFPRMSALCEVVWSPKESRNWEDFKRRMKTEYARYRLWKVNFSTAHFEDILKQ